MIFIASAHGQEYYCNDGTMDMIKIEMGITQKKYPNSFTIENDLVIYIDTTLRAKNFISDMEYHFRTQSVSPDTTAIWNWKNLDQTEKTQLIVNEKLYNDLLADTIHDENNQGQQIIWLINNNKDKINYPTICGTPLLVLQAVNTKHEWQTIRYMQKATCGNCYSIDNLKPKMGIEMISTIPSSGGYNTKLRYKLLANNKFYYSNIFEAEIDYCDFYEKEFKKNDMEEYFSPNPETKLNIKPIWTYN